MDVIVHQYVGVQMAFGIQQELAQKGQVAPAVIVIEEAGQAVVPALDDVLRDVRKVESGQPGHVAMLSTLRPRRKVLFQPAAGKAITLLPVREVNLTPFPVPCMRTC
jgi:hypothetical protein